jgi:hypothetical protein
VIASGGLMVLDQRIIGALGITREQIERVARRSCASWSAASSPPAAAGSGRT